MVTAVEVLTVPAVTENVVEVEPCGMVTVKGTFATALFELDRDTERPPVPAADVMLTVPVALWPVERVVGVTEIPLSAGGGGLTVMTNVSVEL